MYLKNVEINNEIKDEFKLFKLFEKMCCVFKKSMTSYLDI